ncbi:MAG: AAA family ATPase [Pseudomonadota bacterium]
MPQVEATGSAEAPQRSEVREAEGVYLIADIVGSSRICNRLVETEGRRAADRLSTLINASFGPLIGLVSLTAGRVLDTAGDSLHAVWLPGAGEALDMQLAAVEAAAESAMAALAGPPGDTQIPVEARIGIGTGRLAIGESGTSGIASVISGSAIMNALQALAEVEPGEVRVIRGDGLAGEGLDISALPSRLGIFGSAPGVIDPDGETRALSVMSVELAAAGEAFALPVERLEALAAAAERALTPHGAVFETPMLDEKGLTLKAFFGLHGEGEARGRPEVFAALDALTAELGALGAAVRVGVATGRVFLGVFSIAGETRPQCFGLPLVVSTRLMEAAGSHALLDGETARLAGLAERMATPLPPALLKGTHTDIAVSALGPRRAPGSLPGARTGSGQGAPIGREDELARIAAFIARPEIGRALFLRGGAGSGKSELLRHAHAAARAAGATVVPLAPRSYPYDGYLSAWAEALGTLLPGEPPVGPEAGADPAGEADPAARLDQLTLALVERFAEAAPVLVVDDAHRLDEASARLAIRLWRAVPGLRVVAAYDSAAEARIEPWLRRLLVGDDAYLDLGGLSLEATRALLLDRLGVEEIAEDTLARIHALSDGMPDAVLAIGRSARAGLSRYAQRSSDRALGPEAEEVDLPLSVSEAVEQAIGRLGPAARRVLKIASAAGQALDPDLLVRAGAGSAGEVADALETARAAGLVERRAGPRGGALYAFRSERLRNVAYGMMAEATAREAHAALAEAIAATPVRDGRARDAAMAYHWSRTEDRRQALRHLSRAALGAWRRGEYATLLPWLERALSLAEAGRTDPSAPRVSPFREAFWCAVTADAQIQHGNLERASALCRRGLGLLGDRAAGGPWGWIGQGLRASARLATGRLARRPPGIAQRAQYELKGLLYGHLCSCLYFQSDELGMLATALEASDQRERTGTPAGMAMPDAVLAYAAGVSGVGGLSRWFAGRTRRIGAPEDPELGLQYSLGTEALVALALGRLGEAERHIRIAVDLADKRRDRNSAAMARTILGLLLHHAGRFDETAAAFDELGRRARLEGNDQHLAWSLYAEASAFLSLGRTEEAWRRLTTVEPLIALVDDDLSKLNYTAIRAQAALERGEVEAAAEWAAKAHALAAATPLNNWGSFEGFFTSTEVTLSLAAAANGEARAAILAEAQSGLAIAAKFAARYAFARPRLGQHRAVLTALSGGLGAPSHLDRAADRARRYGMAYELARIDALRTRLGRSDAVRAAAARVARDGLARLRAQPIGLARLDLPLPGSAPRRSALSPEGSR